ncbi:MAG: LysR substrate-binding domain-containing protein [Chthoniobacteraceae bacterium]
MELHQLRYLLAVAKTGNFSRAAEQCHISQPSLSQQIAKLEAELGERLFSRLKRRAVLTSAGQALVQRATRIMAEVDAARRDVADAAEQVRGEVSIGVLPTIAPYLLPRVLALTARECPGMEVRIHEATTAQLLASAADCEIDLAIISLPIADARFIRMPLFDEELLLAVPPRHPLTKMPRVRLSDLEGERFILMEEGHCLTDQSLRFCHRNDLHPQIAFRSAQLETIQALVASGVGISLIPKLARHPKRAGQPVYLSLANPKPMRTIGVLWRKEHHHSRAAREFLRLLRQACVAR